MEDGGVPVGDARFPLTPALSRRERGNRFPPCKTGCDWTAWRGVGRTGGVRRLFPLPVGEGQGEGKPSVFPVKPPFAAAPGGDDAAHRPCQYMDVLPALRRGSILWS